VNETPAPERRRAEAAVASDGSPVVVYLNLPEGNAAALVDSAIPPRSRILDLGCGVGRIARGLVERDHSVVGVDNEPAMLRELPTGVEGVLGDVKEVRLGRTFDVILLASNFLNDPTGVPSLLATAREHLVDNGLLVAEVYPPDLDWPGLVGEVRQLGDVEVEVARAKTTGDVVDAEVQYRLGSRMWRQPFVARMRDEDALRASSRTAASPGCAGSSPVTAGSSRVGARRRRRGARGASPRRPRSRSGARLRRRAAASSGRRR
jgi:SAM-dependent methyltransferase